MILSRRQSEKLPVLASVFNSATKVSTDSVGSLSPLLKQYLSKISLTSPVQFLHFVHNHVPVVGVLSTSVAERFDDQQAVIANRVLKHGKLVLRTLLVQSRNNKIIVLFFLP